MGDWEILTLCPPPVQRCPKLETFQNNPQSPHKLTRRRGSPPTNGGQRIFKIFKGSQENCGLTDTSHYFTTGGQMKIGNNRVEVFCDSTIKTLLLKLFCYFVVYRDLGDVSTESRFRTKLFNFCAGCCTLLLLRLDRI